MAPPLHIARAIRNSSSRPQLHTHHAAPSGEGKIIHGARHTGARSIHRDHEHYSNLSLLNEFVMVFLAIASVLLLTFEVILDHQHEYVSLVRNVDLAIASIFLVEFFWHFYKAKNKKHFLAGHWWELLAAIPLSNEATQAMRSIRVLRVFDLIRLLRVIRLAARIGVIVEYSNRFKEETHMVYIGIILGLVAFGGSLSFFMLEHELNPKVLTLFDAFWWTMSTMSTVGYGDIVPFTTAGRVIGIVLMLVGAGLLGIFTAAVASYMIRERSRGEDW